MTVGFVTTYRNNQECLDRLLDDFEKFSPEGSRIVVVDSASQNPPRVRSSDRISIDFIRNPRGTHPSSVNLGVRHLSGCDWIWVFDIDAFPFDENLFTLPSYAERLPNLGMIAPQAVSPQGDFTATGDTREGIIPRYLFGPVGSSFLYRLTGYREATLPGDLVTNKVLFFQSVLVRREVLEQVGYLDESFIAWGVDIDLSLRIRKTGRQLFISRSHKVIHEGGSALKRNDYSRVVFEHQAFAYLMKKFHGKWILVLKPLVFARHFLELFLGGIFKSGDLAYLKVRRQLLSTCLTDYR